MIIDETSMVDIIVMYNLLKAVPPHMTVILIGDIYQLPSIAAGNVLRDIIGSGVVPVIQLEKIFRQAQGSAIIRNAHKISEGKTPDFHNGSKSDFFFLEQDDNSLIPQVISELCSERPPSHYRVNPIMDIQVLCPMQRGETGAQNLNMILQSVLNENTLSIRRGGIEFCLGDKVMQIRNNYDKEVHNGDIGIISNVNLEDRSISVTVDELIIRYDLAETGELCSPTQRQYTNNVTLHNATA